MYSDNFSLIYLKFLQPIVSELNRLTKIFQLDKPNPAKLLTELLTFYQSLLERVGLLKTFCSWHKIMAFNLCDENLCVGHETLVQEIRKRLPDHIKQSEALKLLSQRYVLSSRKPRFDDLPVESNSHSRMK